MSITVTPLSDALGAEIGGVDISRPIDDATARDILQAWYDHLVVVFRDQSPDEAQQTRFAAIFGGLWEVPDLRASGRTASHGHVMSITNIREDGKPIGSLPDGGMMLHVDNIYTAVPAQATTLFALEVPSRGGETRLNNLYKAYEALPQRIKTKIEGRNAIHHYYYGATAIGDKGVDVDAGSYAHPAVIVHPNSGKKALYMCRLMTRAIEGLEPEESDALLAEIFDIAERPEFIYEHKWRVGDLIVWDNRCTAHGRNDFDPAEIRNMRRVSTNVDVPPAEWAARAA